MRSPSFAQLDGQHSLQRGNSEAIVTRTIYGIEEAARQRREAVARVQRDEQRQCRGRPSFSRPPGTRANGQQPAEKETFCPAGRVPQNNGPGEDGHRRRRAGRARRQIANLSASAGEQHVPPHVRLVAAERELRRLRASSLFSILSSLIYFHFL